MRAKLVRLEEMCVSRYRNVFHHMKGDVRKGIITLSEKPAYARRRKSRKSVRVIIVVIRHVFLRNSPDSLDSLTMTTSGVGALRAAAGRRIGRHVTTGSSPQRPQLT
jgi:hypothetical protein